MAELPRDEYLDLISKELLGPGAEPEFQDKTTDISHERITANPSRLYLLGILYPQGAKVKDEAIKIDSGETTEYGYNAAEEMSAEEALTESSDDGMPSESENETGNLDDEAESDSEFDEAFNMTAQFLPSTLGLICLTEGDPEGGSAHVTFGTYRSVGNEKEALWIPYEMPEGFSLPTEYAGYIRYDTSLKRLCLLHRFPQGFHKKFRSSHEDDTPEMKDFMWSVNRLSVFSNEGRIRTPHTFDVKLEFDSNGRCEKELEETGCHAKLIADKHELRDNRFSLTVMLVNMRNDESAQAENCIFQPVIRVLSNSDDAFHFIDKRLADFDFADEEEDSLRLLYLNKHDYATGLGTSATWEVDSDGHGYISTEFFPTAETPRMDWGTANCSMKELSDLSSSTRDEKLAHVEELVDGYEKWICSLEEKSQKLSDDRLKKAAEKNIELCTKAEKRMRQGIEVLRKNDMAYEAFELANHAMFMQRVQLRMQADRKCQSDEERWPGDKATAKWLQDVDYAKEPDKLKGWQAYWRPFQIAFILMVIPDIVDDNAQGRDIADLIWFPTGGGKTEAYLGLTAFTICFRRLTGSPEESGGTTVLMRYTLRLLTAQQFNRAATLICALEMLRREGLANLGSEPITIGLWVGSATPNKLESSNWTNPGARELLEKLTGGRCDTSSIDEKKNRYNHFQVLKCPWCGTKLERGIAIRQDERKVVGVWGYDMDDHFHFFCPQRKCPFNDDYSLPIQVVDEELYNNPPTLLFATVDKFAQMPWQSGRIGAFFGLKSRSRRAPELIIQDELHLIAGALGTMVGLYEAALDAACQQKGVKPKIVASTATVRRATEQCAALYGRQAFQFPPPGLDSSDSFFAREKQLGKDSPGRKYAGLMPSGKTKTMAEIRVLAAMLEMVKGMPNLTDEEIDQLWTLTVYFNNLRELGRASTLLHDEVRDAMRRIAHRRHIVQRSVTYSKELTSRVTATELNKTLDELEHVAYSAANRAQKRFAVNALLATNMISVGLDVSRLNLMLVVGQPKMTSEYIQSTSRIGRKDPGAALVLYRPTNSRDRSYFEHFRDFHQTFYRQVEPSIVTPFSWPAIERGLHAVLISMMRLGLTTYESLSDDKDAIKFSLDDEAMKKQAEWCKNFLLERVRHAYELAPGFISHEEMNKDMQKLSEIIDGFFEFWDEEAKYARKDRVSLSFGHRFYFREPADGTRILMATHQRARAINALDDDVRDKYGPALPTMSSLRSVDIELKCSLIDFKLEAEVDENE